MVAVSLTLMQVDYLLGLFKEQKNPSALETKLASDIAQKLLQAVKKRSA